MTNRYVADPEDIRNGLVEQLVEPVEFVSQVQRLVDDGIRLVVEIGPRQVLTRLTRKIASNVSAVATDNPKLPGIHSLLCVQAMLECHGVTGSMAQRVAAVELTSTVPAELIHFDATARRRERNRKAGLSNEPQPDTTLSAQETSANTRQVVNASADTPDDNINDFLVSFVCEQTGYPPEIVDLDVDLEADLGIDSIKKAQLLGELREHFPIEPTSDLSLDDFPTLRHIGQFIRVSCAKAATSDSADAAVDAPRSRTVHDQDVANSDTGVPGDSHSDGDTATTHRQSANDAHRALNLCRFSGSAAEIGRQHGELEREAIHATMERFVDIAGEQRLEDAQLTDAMEDARVFFGDDGLEELQGIADAVGLPIESTLAFNIALVVPVMQLLPGCTQFVIPAAKNGTEGLIHAVNEDWNLGRVLKGSFRRIAQVRTPDTGFRHLTFGACGQLGGMNGINDQGLAITSTLLLDRMPEFAGQTPGLIHFVLVQRILQQAATIDEALEIVENTQRHSAWSMCLSNHKSDRICYLEYDAANVEVRQLEDLDGSTNHCKLKSHVRDVEGQSLQRHDRMQQLLNGHSTNGDNVRLPVSLAKSVLRDQFDERHGRRTAHPTKWTIRQPDTQASIVMRPASRELWVTADVSRPDEADTFHRLDLDELFEDDAETSELVGSADDTRSMRPHTDRLMNRLILRLVDAPLQKADTPFQFEGRILICGQNATASAVRDQLESRGANVTVLQAVDDPDAAVSELDALWTEGPIAHLFLLTPRDEDAALANGEMWPTRSSRGIMLPYLLCQRWIQRLESDGLSDAATLVAVTGLGGDFGLTDHDGAVEGGGLSGLLKAIQRESPQLLVKIIDAPLADPGPLVARCVLDELASQSPDREVGYQRGFRRTLQVIPASPKPKPRQTVTPGGTWVVTGGGRGITSVIARELGIRYGLKLHLLGSSPRPDVLPEWRDLSASQRRELRAGITRAAREAGDDADAAWQKTERSIELDQNLTTLAAEGVDATYHCCDVSSRGQLDEVLTRIREAGEPIRGVLHAAGIEAACRFDRKQRSVVESTIRTKVDGAIHLFDLMQGDPLEQFIGFGSISGRLGSAGQTDYSLASELLAKVLSHFRKQRPECQTVTMVWPAWDGVGMAVRPESRLALEMGGQQFMPPEEGIAYLIDELETGCQESEVMLLDWPTQRESASSPFTAAEAEAFWRRSSLIADCPLVDGLVDLQDGVSATTELHFDPTTDLFLIEHRHNYVEILPAVVALEALAESAALLKPGSRVYGLHEVEIHNGWRFAGNPEVGRVRVQARSHGQVECKLLSDFRNRNRVITDPSRLYVSGTVLLSPPKRPVSMQWQAPPDRWHELKIETEKERSDQNMVWHGPAFQCLKRVLRDDMTMWGEILVPAENDLCGPRRQGEWLLPSSVLDACLVTCSTLTYVASGTFHLPVACDALHFFERPTPGETCIALTHFKGEDNDQTLFDFGLFTQSGRLLLAAESYRGAIIVRPGDEP